MGKACWIPRGKVSRAAGRNLDDLMEMVPVAPGEKKMYTRIVMDNGFLGTPSASWLPYAILGSGMILFGVAIMVFPELLVALVALFFFIVGGFLLTLAMGMRRLSRKMWVDPQVPTAERWEDRNI